MSEKFRTKLITAGRKERYTQGGVSPVIQRASSLLFPTLKDKAFRGKNAKNKEFIYGRRGGLTQFAFQDAMTELENSAGCALYPSGVAAITTPILAFVKSGDNILVPGNVYEPVRSFCETILTRMNVTTTYYDPSIGSNISALIQPETTIVYMESPGSITMEVQDVSGIVKAVKSVNPDIITMIDNTYAAGVLFRPLDHGVDISMQSGTKYVTGHSDILLGMAMSNEKHWDQLFEYSYLMGQTVDPDTAYMALRGLRTILLRLDYHHEAGLKVANWLKSRDEVDKVFHPMLDDCKGSEIFKRDFSGANGLFSFVLKEHLTPERAAEFIENFDHFAMAYSWGGYESLMLMNQPEELEKFRHEGGVDFNGSLFRIHIGLEDVDDLIADLEKGFDRLKNSTFKPSAKGEAKSHETAH